MQSGGEAYIEEYYMRKKNEENRWHSATADLLYCILQEWSIRPYFVWRTVFSVCTIPDQRPSLRGDQRLGQVGFSPSRTTTSPTVYFQESRVAVQHPFPIMYYILCLNTFQVIQLIWTFSYFGDDARTTFSDRRCIVTMLAARRRSDTFVVGLIQVIWTSRIWGALIINCSETWCFM